MKTTLTELEAKETEAILNNYHFAGQNYLSLHESKCAMVEFAAEKQKRIDELEYKLTKSQSYPTPTEAEINEAAIKCGLQYGVGRYAIVERSFKQAIQWIQNYQTQGREKPEHGTYTESEVKLIATRFARQSRLMNDVTSNDTIQSFDSWFKPENFNQASQPNPAIAVIEGEIKNLQDHILDCDVMHCQLCSTDGYTISKLETILKQIKA